MLRNSFAACRLGLRASRELLRRYGQFNQALNIQTLGQQFQNSDQHPDLRPEWLYDTVTPPTAERDSSFPRITIVTPTLNQGPFIEETIRSVVLQRYPNLEYIIIDGGSTDGTVEIIKKYEPWLSFWESVPDHGQADALNKGFARATGEICAYINSDDYYLPGAFNYVASMRRRTGFNFLFGRNHLAEPDRSRKGVIRKLFLPIPHPLILGHPIYEVVQDASFWSLDNSTRFSDKFHFCLDVEFFLRSVGGCTVVMTDRALSFFREHPASKTALNQAVCAREHNQLLRWMEGRHASPAAQASIVWQWRFQNSLTVGARLLGGREPAEFRYVHPES